MECEVWCERRAKVDDSDLKGLDIGRVVVRQANGRSSWYSLSS